MNNKIPAIIICAFLIVGCSEYQVSNERYVDINNDSNTDIVFSKYEGKGVGDKVWGIYVLEEGIQRKIFTLKETSEYRFEDINRDGFPDIVFELYSGKGVGDDVWDIYFVINHNGIFSQPVKTMKIDKENGTSEYYGK